MANAGPGTNGSQARALAALAELMPARAALAELAPALAALAELTPAR